MILPAALRYQTELALNLHGAEGGRRRGRHRRRWTSVSAPLADLRAGARRRCGAALDADHGDDRRWTRPTYAKDVLLPAMAAVRAAADMLEGVVADDLWPLPTYQEMLFIL